ncbi:adenosylcobinamide-phosphate synthase CbiB [Halodesulfurarchaeum sp.]|uniref:adenosylcobinamide-phosphate synthase CbiB n=1 Tax=Halodesulfurarchaeum sp. TaxID=1980530 RepID=UPI001BC2E5DE|nr:cobalamin biosynthesis protein CobD [Halodesulfurarchaeum sp.]
MAPIGALAVGVAFVLDAVVGEPPESVHPVAQLGQVIGALDHNFSRPGIVGTVIAVLLPLAFAVLAGGSVWLLGHVNPLLAGLFGGLILFTMLSLDMLTGLTSRVIDATETDPEQAKQDVIGLVGRNTESLSPAELRSAAVESLAENLADGLVGPLLAFAIGSLVSLPVAVGTAAWVKGVNTLDSMLGYPDRPLGTASARLDDVVEWVPARLSAALIAVAAVDPLALSRAQAWVGEPQSPNSGWPMAAMAATLDIRLRKPDAYDLNPTASFPSLDRAHEAVQVGTRAGILAFVLAGVIAWF